MSESTLKGSAKKGFKAPILNAPGPDKESKHQDNVPTSKKKEKKMKNNLEENSELGEGHLPCPKVKKPKKNLKENHELEEGYHPPQKEKKPQKKQGENLESGRYPKKEKKPKKMIEKKVQSGQGELSLQKEKKLKKPEISLSDSQYEEIFKAVLSASSSQPNTPIEDILKAVASCSEKSSKESQNKPVGGSESQSTTSFKSKKPTLISIELSPWGSHFSKQPSQAANLLKGLRESQASSLLNSVKMSNSEKDAEVDVVSQKSIEELSQCSSTGGLRDKRARLEELQAAHNVGVWGLQESQASNLQMSDSEEDSEVDTVSQTSEEELNQHNSTGGLRDKRARLEELQAARNVGVWVFCDRMSCQKQRYLPDVKDPQDLPDIWYCHMNPDQRYNSCSYPEQQPSLEEEEDMIDNQFTCGSVVWARVQGFPWWPAMVDDDPDLECYYWLLEDMRTVTFYHVVFFDKNEVTRAWVSVRHIMSYKKNLNYTPRIVRGIDFTPRLQVAKEQADDAALMTITQRLKKYSFISRFKGPIPDDVAKGGKTRRKYKLKCYIGGKVARKRGLKRSVDSNEAGSTMSKKKRDREGRPKSTTNDLSKLESFKTVQTNQIHKKGKKKKIIPNKNIRSSEMCSKIELTERHNNSESEMVPSVVPASITQLSDVLQEEQNNQTENLKPETNNVGNEISKGERKEGSDESETPSEIMGLCENLNFAEESPQNATVNAEIKTPSITESNLSQKSKSSGVKVITGIEQNTEDSFDSVIEPSQAFESSRVRNQDSHQNKLSQSTISEFLIQECEDAVVPDGSLSQQSEPFEE